MYSKRSFFISAILGCAVFWTSWLSINSVETPTDATTNIQMQTQLPTIKQYTVSGVMKYQLNSKTAIQYSNGTSHLISPELTLYNLTIANAPPYHIESNFADIDTEQNIKAYGHVITTRASFAQMPAMKFTTKRLWANQQTQIIHTPDPVHFSQPALANTTDAIGLKANLKSHTLTLLSHVKTHYERF